MGGLPGRAPASELLSRDTGNVQAYMSMDGERSNSRFPMAGLGMERAQGEVESGYRHVGIMWGSLQGACLL